MQLLSYISENEVFSWQTSSKHSSNFLMQGPLSVRLEAGGGLSVKESNSKQYIKFKEH